MFTQKTITKEFVNEETSKDLDRLLDRPVRSTLAFDSDALGAMGAAAKAMASAKVTIPKHLQGSPGDCLAIIFQAQQWGMNPFAVAQKTHIVNGTLGYEAQLVNAVVSSSSLLASRIAYQWEGEWKGCNGKTDKDDSRACTISATLRGESHPRTLRVSMAQVGDVRNSPLWVSDPRQQLAYLATKRWVRLHAPDVLLGVYTTDELAEIEVIEPAPASSLRARLLDPQDTEPAQEDDVPDVAKVIRAIMESESEQDLSAAAALAGKLTDNADKAEARLAFKDRREALQEAAKQPAEPPEHDDWIDAATQGV